MYSKSPGKAQWQTRQGYLVGRTLWFWDEYGDTHTASGFALFGAVRMKMGMVAGGTNLGGMDVGCGHAGITQLQSVGARQTHRPYALPLRGKKVFPRLEVPAERINGPCI
jgi:hypothetical protein